jgi:hypothetical protein
MTFAPFHDDGAPELCDPSAIPSTKKFAVEPERLTPPRCHFPSLIVEFPATQADPFQKFNFPEFGEMLTLSAYPWNGEPELYAPKM